MVEMHRVVSLLNPVSLMGKAVEGSRRMNVIKLFIDRSILMTKLISLIY